MIIEVEVTQEQFARLQAMDSLLSRLTNLQYKGRNEKFDIIDQYEVEKETLVNSGIITQLTKATRLNKSETLGA